MAEIICCYFYVYFRHTFQPTDPNLHIFIKTFITSFWIICWIKSDINQQDFKIADLVKSE